MRYCPDCGDPHECAAQVAMDDGKTQIRIAEINANRDVRLAELRAAETATEVAGAVDVASSELLAETARAEGEADGMREVIDAATGPDVAEPDPPMVVDVAEPEPEPEPEMAPPPAEHHETSSRGNTWHW